MIREYLSKQDDFVLWSLLADISGIMGSRVRESPADNFWIAAAGEVKAEIDKRLFIEYEGKENGI